MQKLKFPDLETKNHRIQKLKIPDSETKKIPTSAKPKITQALGVGLGGVQISIDLRPSTISCIHKGLELLGAS